MVKRFVLVADAEWYEKYLRQEGIRWTKKLMVDGRGYIYKLY